MLELKLLLEGAPAGALVGVETETIIKATLSDETGSRSPLVGASTAPVAVDICLLVDRSASMRTAVTKNAIPTDEVADIEGGTRTVVKPIGRDGETVKSRLDICREAAVNLLDKIGPADKLSVVAFAGDAVPIVRSLSKDEGLDAARAAISGLAAQDNTTRMDLGLLAAEKLLGPEKPGRVRRAIMLTDGLPTLEDAAIEAGRKLAEAGIVVEAYGFGDSTDQQFNQVLMQRLVTPSRGRALAINAPEAIVYEFRQRLEAAQAIIARNAEVTLSFEPEHVHLAEAYRGAPSNAYLGPVHSHAHDGGLSTAVIKLGDLKAQEPLTLYIKASTFGHKAATSAWPMLEVGIVCEDTDGRQLPPLQQSLKIPVVKDRLALNGNAEVLHEWYVVETQKFQNARGEALAKREQFLAAKDAAAANKERQAAITYTERIIENFEKARKTNDEIQYDRKILADLLDGKEIDQDKVNKSSTSSTLPMKSGVKTMRARGEKAK